MARIVTTKKKKSGKNRNLPVIAFIAVIVISVGLWFWLGGDASSVTNNNDAGMHRPPVNEVQQNPMQDASSSKVRQDAVPPTVAEDGDHPLRGSENSELSPKVPRKRSSDRPSAEDFVYPTPGQALLRSGRILTYKPPKEGESVTIYDSGLFYTCYADGTYDVKEPKPVFDNMFDEQLISVAMPGKTFLPGVLLNHTEEELIAMLGREVVISPDDPPDIVDKKEAVAALKKFLIDYLNGGGSYEDFIEEMSNYSRTEWRLHVDGINKIYEFIENGKPEEAAIFVEKYNAILSEQEFSPLRLPADIDKVLLSDVVE